MRFGNLLNYLPSALMVGLAAGIYLGAYDFHRDLREIGDSMGNMVDMRTVGQLEIINYDLVEIHESLQDIHEIMQDHIQERDARASLDSVASLP